MPQPPQCFSIAAFIFPHLRHGSHSLAPQLAQKRRSDRFSASQAAHVKECEEPDMRGKDAAAGALTEVIAMVRSSFGTLCRPE